MKKFIIAALAFTFLAGTASAQASKSTSTATKSPATTTIDLSSIGMNATMTVPAGVQAVEGKYDNSIKGPGNFEISIETTGQTIEQVKKNTQADDMNIFQKFLATDANGFMYTSKIMGETPAHFEYIATIGDVTYRFYDKRVTPLTPAQLQPMYDAIKTLKAK